MESLEHLLDMLLLVHEYLQIIVTLHQHYQALAAILKHLRFSAPRCYRPTLDYLRHLQGCLLWDQAS